MKEGLGIQDSLEIPIEKESLEQVCLKYNLIEKKLWNGSDYEL